MTWFLLLCFTAYHEKSCDLTEVYNKRACEYIGRRALQHPHVSSYRCYGVPK